MPKYKVTYLKHGSNVERLTKEIEDVQSMAGRSGDQVTAFYGPANHLVFAVATPLLITVEVVDGK